MPSEVAIGPDDGVKQPSAINLHNVLTIQKRHIGRRVARLSDDKMRDVCRAIAFVVGCES